MAVVLTPEAPLPDWLAGLDAEIARVGSFFLERPVVLDLGLFGDQAGAADELSLEMASRGIRLIATENAAIEFDALPGKLAGGRETGDVAIPDTHEPPAMVHASAPAAPFLPRSLLIDTPIRSGQQIVHPEGDVTIIGGVASGAEVMAGGSIHVYGTLRGRAIAGFGGNRLARIMCRRLQAELLAIDGFYATADDIEPGLAGGPAMARLDDEQLTITGLD